MVLHVYKIKFNESITQADNFIGYIIENYGLYHVIKLNFNGDKFKIFDMANANLQKFLDAHIKGELRKNHLYLEINDMYKIIQESYRKRPVTNNLIELEDKTSNTPCFVIPKFYEQCTGVVQEKHSLETSKICDRSFEHNELFTETTGVNNSSETNNHIDNIDWEQVTQNSYKFTFRNVTVLELFLKMQKVILTHVKQPYGVIAKENCALKLWIDLNVKVTCSTIMKLLSLNKNDRNTKVSNTIIFIISKCSSFDEYRKSFHK